MYVVLLPNEKHIICMGCDNKWDDNYVYYYYDYYYYYYYYDYDCDYYYDYYYYDYKPDISNKGI
jgi:hypothetical protein